MNKPLDLGLNKAIIATTKLLLPNGFDVADEAPGTFKELRDHLNAGKRLVVYGGGCEGTIYVDPGVNHAFRAWHDLTHWKGGHDFSLEGETATCKEQCRQLIGLYGDDHQTHEWCDILRAEVIGQRRFYQWYKRYVDDQRGFVESYLRDPELALLWAFW